MDRAMSYLYDREYSADRNTRKNGSLDDSSLTVPEWINETHELFPKQCIDRLEKDALERYELSEMVNNPDVLERANPSEGLLKAILRTKNLMNQEVLKKAKQLVAKVIAELLEKLVREIETPFLGTRNRNKRSFFKLARNFDIKKTIRHNLRHYQPDTKKMLIEQIYFNSRVRTQSDKWRLFILVDESGSMLDSVIHSAVTAAIFWNIKALQTRLVLFDTNIVDVSDHCQDPVETLMKVQLGGGTDIGRALAYVRSLMDNPAKTLVILISDFYEGAPEHIMLHHASAIVQSGAKLLCLAALDGNADPCYDRVIAQRLVKLGAAVGAMTPGELARWVGEQIS